MGDWFGVNEGVLALRSDVRRPSFAPVPARAILPANGFAGALGWERLRRQLVALFGERRISEELEKCHDHQEYADRH